MSDLIRREDVIKSLQSMMRDCSSEAKEELDTIVTTVRKIPSVNKAIAKVDIRPFSDIELYKCHYCQYFANKGFIYCPACGMKLDWSE